jgi:hypothetical protein
MGDATGDVDRVSDAQLHEPAVQRHLRRASDNPDRLRSEAAFSMLCGASP